jgi:LPXTG-motif cell wall-anchored protein
MKLKWQSLFTVLLACTLVFGSYQPIGFAEEQAETISVHGTEQTGILLEETNYTYEENATAFDVLVNTVGAENVLYSESQYGKMITSIKGLAAKDTYFWAFYINGLSAQVGADSYIVQEGDELSFHYVDWTSAFGEPVSLKVVGDNNKGVITDTKLSFIEEPTAYELLRVVMGPEKIDAADTSFGKMINGIDGLAAEGTYYWAFYVNGESATVGADSYILQPGDEISFQYESWETPTEGETESPVEGEVPAISPEDLQTKVDATFDYVLANEMSDWEVVALKQAGKAIPTSYLENLKALIKEKEGKFSRVTDTERYTLGILAAGGNPVDIEGYNLVAAIYNGNLTKQGLNGVTYGLIALDSASFEVPEDALWTREKLVNYLLDQQNEDGGWSWDGGTASDLDTTGMVLTALSNYHDEEVAKRAIDLAVSFLSTQYQEGKINNSSTAAQVIIALSSLGVDAGGIDFTQNQVSLLSYFLTFQNADGGFDWQGGDVSDVFSTAQGAQALVAYQLFVNTKGSLYKLPLVAEVPEQGKQPEEKAPTEGQPTVEQPKDIQPAVEPLKTDTTTITKEAGKALPNTATNMYNTLVLGFFLLCLGVITFVWRRRKAV